MTIQLIENKGFPILFAFGKNIYHMWSWRTITIANKATYQATIKQDQLGWYTPDGWLSYNQIKAAVKNGLVETMKPPLPTYPANVCVK